MEFEYRHQADEDEYWRTLPGVEIRFGQFLVRPKIDPPDPPPFVPGHYRLAGDPLAVVYWLDSAARLEYYYPNNTGVRVEVTPVVEP
jgi:hypothetical protein